MAEELAAHGGHAVAVRVDVSDDAAVGQLVDEIVSRHGRIDVVFNNAAIGPSAADTYPMTDVVGTPPEAWDAILAINLKGPP